MSLHEDLQIQALHLAELEQRRPRQASLRRAVSAAYYSLFHLLVDESTKMMFGQSANRRAFRDVLARGFAHATMAEACRSFRGGSLPAQIDIVVRPLTIPTDLRTVASTFVRLQEERHRADYNRALPFSKAEVQNLLQEATDAAMAWQQVRDDEVAKFFLIALPLWSNIRR